jgi:3,8-divinyl chlorophyllide a/chlorophyllide a reductase subunit Z
LQFEKMIDTPNSVPAGGKKHAPIKLIRDLESTSGYWAAIWTLCVMPDVHVVVDAPIGCYNLIAQAVTDYTDAIADIDNITPSTMREQEVTMLGTAGKVRATVEAVRQIHPGKAVIVLSTAESEMISSDHGDWLSKMNPPVPFFWSQSLEGDEYIGRDRILAWLWDNFGRNSRYEITNSGSNGASMSVEPPNLESGIWNSEKPRSALVNVIGTTYGCFNGPADLHEIKRLVEGAGGVLNLVYPFESKLADTPKLADAAVNVLMYREYGETLAKKLDKPFLYAPMGVRETTAFVEKLGELLGTQDKAAAFIAREKKTTLLPVWDLWKGVQSDWFATTEFAVVAGQTYTEGLVKMLSEEFGMKLQFAAARPYQPGGMDNIAIRETLHKKQPGFLFGSQNEKIYLTEAGAKATFYIPASFPGAIVRRALGTPFMGYSGVVYVLQEIINRYYEIVFNFLPYDDVKSAGQLRQVDNPLTGASNLKWTDDARNSMDSHLEGVPWLSRISATRELRSTVERYALRNAVSEVTADVVKDALMGQ